MKEEQTDPAARTWRQTIQALSEHVREVDMDFEQWLEAFDEAVEEAESRLRITEQELARAHAALERIRDGDPHPQAVAWEALNPAQEPEKP